MSYFCSYIGYFFSPKHEKTILKCRMRSLCACVSSKRLTTICLTCVARFAGPVVLRLWVLPLCGSGRRHADRHQMLHTRMSRTVGECRRGTFSRIGSSGNPSAIIIYLLICLKHELHSIKHELHIRNEIKLGRDKTNMKVTFGSILVWGEAT